MRLTYHPEGSEEPTVWRYTPHRIMSVEREMLEKRTGRSFAKFTNDVIQGDSTCRRALLFMFLKRDHPTTKYEDVDFAWDEFQLDFSRGELELMREELLKVGPSDEQAAALAQFEGQIEDAFDDPDESGKARLPIVG